MKKSIDKSLTNKKRRERQSLKARQSRRELRHEVLEARQLLDANSYTIVLDFVDDTQGTLVDPGGNPFTAFDPTDFGLTTTQQPQLENTVLTRVRDAFLNIPDAGTDPLSPLPAGTELDIDVFIGDHGVTPQNGASEYYVLAIGSGGTTFGGVVGTTNIRESRDGTGTETPGRAASGDVIGGLYVDFANQLLSNAAGGLTPSDILVSGDIDASAWAIANFAIHDIARATSLSDVSNSSTVSNLRGLPAAMTVTNIDGIAQDWLDEREFSLSHGNPGNELFPIQQLIGELGTRPKVGLPPQVETSAASPQLISVNPNESGIFTNTIDVGLGGVPDASANRIDFSPTELTLRFASGAPLDPTTLDGGIEITRSVNGVFGDGDDQVIDPGFLGLGDTDRIVIARFSETLPDDVYRVRIFGFDDSSRNITGVRAVSTDPAVEGALFESALDRFGAEVDGINDDAETLFFELELGAQVIAVVPQPVSRNGAGQLIQEKDRIIVYFNDDDLHDTAVATTGAPTDPTVVRPEFYNLILTQDTVNNNDDVVVNPTLVQYDPDLDRAVLTFSPNMFGFGALLEEATFRLRIGSASDVAEAAAPIRPTIQDLIVSDIGSSFDTASQVLGVLGDTQQPEANLISQEIRALNDYVLEAPGGFDEPGQREFNFQQHILTADGDVQSGGQGDSAISTLYYNFNTTIPYGVNDLGQQLTNAITEVQKERSREVFELLGEEWGLEFVETSSHFVNGVPGVSLTVVTGDLVVAGLESGPGGFFGTSINTPDAGSAHTFGRTIALLDGGEQWFSERSLPEITDTTSLSYFAHAMTVIGSALGIGSASEAPPGTVINGVIFNDTLGGERDYLTSNPVEPSIPGDQDNIRGQHLFRAESRDIDVYEFSIPDGTSGTFTAETFAERRDTGASLLDSYLSLYQIDDDGSQQLIARNDNYYGDDSFIELTLEGGEYFLAVSASGNDAFDLAVADSGLGGTTEGRYELLVNFIPETGAEILDFGSNTALDGDGDGQAGGDFNFWFRATNGEGNIDGVTPAGPRTLFVDKAHPTVIGFNVPVGTLANPYSSVQDAFDDALPGDTVRIVGNGGLDNDISTVADNFAYEIGRGGPSNLPLADGLDLNVPKGVSVQVDAGAVFKLKGSRIGVGSSSGNIDLSGGSLQVLGTPYLADVNGNPVVGLGPSTGRVLFTSYDDETVGVDTNPLVTTPNRGNWGGIEFRNDVDNAEGRRNLEREGIFLNYVAHGDFQYGGGQVTANSQARVVNPIHMTAARPTIINNTISLSADAAVSADGDSFEETNFNSPQFQRNGVFVSNYDRVGPDIRGNVLTGNTTNGLFVRVDTPPGEAIQELVVSARWDDTDIVHVVGENIIIAGTPGGPILEETRPPAGGLIPVSQPATGDTTLPTATFNYRITFVDRFGGESLQSDSSANVDAVAGEEVRITNIPAAVDDFVSRRVYRSQPGGGGPFDLIAELDKSSTQYIDRGGQLGAALNGIQAIVETNLTSTLPAGSYTYRFTLANPSALDPADVEVRIEDEVTVTVGGAQQVRLDNLPGSETSNSFGLALGLNGRTELRNVYRSNPFTGEFDFIGSTGLNEGTFTDVGGAIIPGATTSGVPFEDMNTTVVATQFRARPNARLAIDPAVIVKIEGARFETEIGAQFLAEGIDGKRVIFTSRADDSFGAGGTFDTNDDANANTPTQPSPGDWGGIHIGPAGSASIDFAYIAFAGGVVETGGTFAGFNAIEVIDAEARIANSILEQNASGLGGQADSQRDGHGFNEPAVIFVRGSQPIIVDNIIRDNNVVTNVGSTAAISINVNALNSEIVLDYGRQTGVASENTDVISNFGPLIRGNRLGNNALNGVAIRGGVLTTESVWDDTDIVHIVESLRTDLQLNQPEVIIAPDLSTFGGLRLQSSPTESLVVKFGAGAQLVASGRPLDIEDRIGGIVQVLGAPGFPVVLTSITDDAVGAGFDPLGQAQLDTNNDGTFTTDRSVVWGGILLDQFSHDRNVETLQELESPNIAARADSVQNNGTPGNAQFLGGIAPSEFSGDDNLRLGFTIHGVIANPSDVDSYSFEAQSGTEVWIDIDRTSQSLDTIVEVINADGEILALSENSHAESGGANTLLQNPALLPPDSLHGLQRQAQSPTNAIDGSFRDDYSTNVRDAGMRVVLPGSSGTLNTYFVRVRSNNQAPGAATVRNITDENAADYEGNLINDGITRGNYQLQLRINETQEHGGSTVRLTNISNASTGIEVRGLPIHSPLLGEATETFATDDGNDTIGGAQDLGTLNASDRAAISIAGQLFDLPNGLRTDDVDWFQFTLEPESDDPSVSTALHTPIVIDVDYADGLARPNTSVWLFGSNERNPGGAPQLVAFGTDSNILDDQGAPLDGVDQDDFSRGSAGTLDAWIGTLSLTGGDYFLAVTNNSRVSSQLDQFQLSNPANPLVRVEPLSSVTRIASDHDFDGDGLQDNYSFLTNPPTPLLNSSTATPPITVAFDGNSNALDFTLSDVVLYVTSGTALQTVDPFTGLVESTVSDTRIGNTTRSLGDIALRPDGNLYGFGGAGITNDVNYDDFLLLNTDGGDPTQAGNANIATFEINDAGTAASRARSNDINGNPTTGDSLSFEAITFAGRSGAFLQDGASAGDLALLSVSHRQDSQVDAIHDTNWIFWHDASSGAAKSRSQDTAGHRGNANGVVNPAATEFQSGTTVIERGFIDTTQDAFINTSNAVLAFDATGELFDGDAITLSNGATIEIDKAPTLVFDPSAEATRDGMFFTIQDSSFFGGINGFEIDTGRSLVVNINSITDGDTFELATSTGFPITFEIDTDGAVGLNNVAIDISGLTLNSEITQRITDTVNGVGIQDLSASTDGTATIDFQGDSGLVTNSPGLTTVGDYGVVNAGATPIVVDLFATGPEIAAAAGPAISSVGTLTAQAPEVSSTFSGGLDLDTLNWTLDNDPFITGSTTVPHVTVNAVGAGGFDRYDFTIENAGDSAIFDIDFGDGLGVGDFDSYVTLFDSADNQLVVSDDLFPTDPGSSSTLDSFLQFTAPAAGDYYIIVADFPGTDAIAPGATYTLHASIENHPLGTGTGGVPGGAGTVVVGGATAFDFNALLGVSSQAAEADEVGAVIDFTARGVADNDSLVFTRSDGLTETIGIDTGESFQVTDATMINDGDQIEIQYFDGNFVQQTITLEFDTDDSNPANAIDISGHDPADPLTTFTELQIATAVFNAVTALTGAPAGVAGFEGVRTHLLNDTIDLSQEDTAGTGFALVSNSPGVTVVGDYGLPIFVDRIVDVAIDATEADFSNALRQELSENPNLFGNTIDVDLDESSIVFTFARVTALDSSNAPYVVSTGAVDFVGVSPFATPLPIIPGESAGQIIGRLQRLLETGFGINTTSTANTVIMGSQETTTFLPGQTSNNFLTLADTGGRIRGLTTVEDFGTVELYAVSDTGGLYRAISQFGGSFDLSDSSNRGDYITTIFDRAGQPVVFSGLEIGPRNVDNGRLSQTLFGIASNGDIYAFDTLGRPVAAFADGQSVISTGVFGATGLAFANLDVNLWHASNSTRRNDDGHGVEGAADGNAQRNNLNSAGEIDASNSHLYFGFESPRNTPTINGNPAIQDGVWTGIYDIGNNGNNGIQANYAGNYQSYDFPGGALGSIESNSLNLSDYSPSDLPALYFNYYLETENANDDFNGFSVTNRDDWMLDSFRVYAAGEDGFWQLLATNNSDRTPFGTNVSTNPVQPFTNASGTNDEFDQVVAGGTEIVQELFDAGDGTNPDSWRQARVDLSDFAGQDGVRIRFDFSTAGSLGIGDATLGGEEIRAVPGDHFSDGQLIVLQDVNDASTTTLEVDLGLELRVPSGANLAVGEFLQVDGTRINFVNGPAGFNEVSFTEFDSSNVIAQRISTALQNSGFIVESDPVNTNRLNVTNAGRGQASAGLPAEFVSGQSGVAAGNTPINIHNGMTTAEVAQALQTALAAGINVAEATSVGDTFPVINDYIVKVYNHEVIFVETFGLSRHGSVKNGTAFTANGGLQDNAYPADEFGQFTSSRIDNAFRGQQNNFEGVYIDDIIIGFRERGEMVSNATVNDTGFSDNLEYEPTTFTRSINEVEQGHYQVEIRRGADYGVDGGDGSLDDLVLLRNFDTNDRLANSSAINAPAPGQVFDGQTFVIGDGTNFLTFEFEDESLVAGNPNIGIGTGNVPVPFNPLNGMTSAELGRNIRDAINSNQAQAVFDIQATMGDGAEFNDLTTSGTVSSSDRVILHGNAVSNGFGIADFGNLDGLLPTDQFGQVQAGLPDTDTVLFGADNFGLVDFGDRNIHRDQGQLILQGNVITNSVNFGINVIPGLRDVTGGLTPNNFDNIVDSPEAGVLPHLGPVRSTQELNSERLTPGVTIVNNLITGSGSAGIVLRGDSTSENQDPGAVPFARVINNTIYGTGAGVGILVAENSGPTLVNNIVANLGVGISVDISSDATTEVSSTLYHQNNNNSTFRNSDLGTFSVVVPDAEQVFVDPADSDFFLQAGSAAIDSSLEAINDRTYLLGIKSPLGIGASPILAPDRDITGQLRVDDPSVSSPLGIGQNVFKDRGALERITDQVTLAATLITPQDNDTDGNDVDPNNTFVQLLSGSLEAFEILISDVNGTGPDADTIVPDAITVTENGRLLVEGVDYSFGFAPTNRTILLTPLTGVWRENTAYDITLNNRDRLVFEAPSGSEVQDGEQFTIIDEDGVEVVLEYESGFIAVVPETLRITVPRTGGSTIVDGESFSVSNDGVVTEFEFTTDANFVGTRAPINYNLTDTPEQIRDAILLALQSQPLLNLNPKIVDTNQVHLGSTSSHTLVTTSTTIEQSGISTGVTEGDSFVVIDSVTSTRFEYVFAGNAPTDPNSIPIVINASDTHEEIAATLTNAVAQANVNFDLARDLGAGVVQLGGVSGQTIDTATTAMNTIGSPGVGDSLVLSIPNIVNDGETFSLTRAGVTTGFEFNDVNVDSATTPGNQIIDISSATSPTEVAQQIANVIAGSTVGITPTIEGNGRLRLNEFVGITYNQGTTGIVASGIPGGAQPVFFSPINFTSTQMALEITRAIADIEDRANPNDGTFAAQSSLRGGGTIFLAGVTSVTGGTSTDVQGIRNNAGNLLAANRSNGETQFTILTPGLELDFGDAPDSYGTTLSNDGARHVLVPDSVLLGSNVGDVDGEADGVPSVNADGDDIAGTIGNNDEDGVDLTQSFFNPFLTTEIQVTVTGIGVLDGWVDFNRDGDFNDFGEKIVDTLPVTGGTLSIPVTTPATNFVPGLTYARFRVSTSGGGGPDGLLAGGEVEDYLVENIAGTPPTVNNDTFITNEDQVLVVSPSGVLINDFDPDSGSNTGLTIYDEDRTGFPKQFNLPAGDVSLNQDGSFTFLPTQDFFGEATFTYRAFDGGLPSNEVATVTLSITPVNDPPVVGDDPDPTSGLTSFERLEDTVVRIPFATLLANDLPGPDNELDQSITITTVAGVSPSTDSTVSVPLSAVIDQVNQEVVITPQQHTNGIGKLIYFVSDNGSPIATSLIPGTVTLEFLGVNDAPVPDEQAHENLNLEVSEDANRELLFDVQRILNNDDPAPNRTPTDQAIDELAVQTLEFTSVDLVSENGGIVEYDAAQGLVFYTPPEDFFGTDAIFYTISDLDPTSSTGLPQSFQENVAGGFSPINDQKSTRGRITLTVTPTNDAPTIGSAQLEALEGDTNRSFDQILNAFGASAGPGENEPLSLTTLGGGIAGTSSAGGSFDLVAVGSDFRLNYTPLADFFGDDEIVLRLSDDPSAPQAPLSTEFTVTVTVRPVNDPPVAPNAGVTTQRMIEDTVGIFDPADLLGNAGVDGVSPPGTSEALADAGNTPQSLIVTGVRLGGSAPAGASVQLRNDGLVELTAPENFYTQDDSGNAVAPPIEIIYTVSDQGISYVENSVGTLVPTSDPQTVDISLLVEVFPENDTPVGLTHQILGQALEDTTFTIDSSSLLPTAAVVAGLAAGAGLPGGLDSAGPGEDLGFDNVKNPITETLSQSLRLLSPVAGVTQIVTELGGTVDFIDSDLTSPGFETIQYNPPVNFASENSTQLDSFTYLIQDNGVSYQLDAAGNAIPVSNSQRVSTATVQIEVVPVNDPPQFFIDSDVTVSEDSIVSDPTDVGFVSIPNFIQGIRPGPSDAIDEAGQLVSFIVETDRPALFQSDPQDPVRPDLSIDQAGTLTFRLAQDANGPTVITVRAVDDDSLNPESSVAQTFTLSVTPVNDAPVFGFPGSPGTPTPITIAEDSGFQLIEDFASSIAPGPSSAGDEQSQAIVFDVTTDRPELFTLPPAMGNDGNLRFTSAPNATGTARVTIVARDSGLSQSPNVNVSDPVELDIIITPVNDAPFTTDDTYEGDENQSLQIVLPGVLSNDVDIDGDAIFVTSIGGTNSLIGLSSQGATVSMQGNGAFVYDPSSSSVLDSLSDGESIVDTFTYSIQDAFGEPGVTQGRVSITVSGRNDAPRIGSADFRVARDRPTTFNVLSDTSDPDSFVDVSSVQILQAPFNGTLVNNFDGTLTFTPREGFVGSESFTFQVSDVDGLPSAVSLGTIDVVNPPATEVDVATTSSNRSVEINVLANDTDTGGGINAASVALFGAPQNGTVELLGDGIVRFTPTPGFAGTAQFQYTVSDLFGLQSDPTRVIVSVARSEGQNNSNINDVNASGQISPIDGLLIINNINRRGVLSVDDYVSEGIITAAGPFLDVDGDGMVAPIDALRVINFLNQSSQTLSGEGEQALSVPDISSVTIGAGEWMAEPEREENLAETAALAMVSVVDETEIQSAVDLDQIIDDIADSEEDDDNTDGLDAFWSNF